MLSSFAFLYYLGLTLSLRLSLCRIPYLVSIYVLRVNKFSLINIVRALAEDLFDICPILSSVPGLPFLESRMNTAHILNVIVGFG